MKVTAVWSAVCSLCLLNVAKSESFYSFHVEDDTGERISFEQFWGKVVLVANTASACGYTDSNFKFYKEIADRFGEQGLELALFPCNQFGKQEPLDAPALRGWVDERFGLDVRFFAKQDCIGEGRPKMWSYLEDQTGSEPATWNFDGKFLISRDGRVLRRFNNNDDFADITAAIEAALQQSVKSDL